MSCRASPLLSIRYHTRANVVDELDFAAQIIDAPGTKARRFVRFEWSFGDVSTSTTSQPFVIHDYSRRAQSRLYSSYLVEVKAFADSGETVSGRTTIEFLNFAYHNLLKFGRVTILTKPNPRFPVLSSDGVVHQTFELWHNYSEPVEIDRIRLFHIDLSGRRRDSGEQADIARLSQASIDVGERVPIDLDLAVSQHPDLVGIAYIIEGTAGDGRPADGEAVVMKPPPTPTRENAVPVADRKVAAKIRMAMKILGKQSVSLEEMWELEREGKLPSSNR
jgi:hypothetical protein